MSLEALYFVAQIIAALALGAYWQQWCMYFIDVRTQHDLGVISAPIWENYVSTFPRVCASPGARRWWQEHGSRQYSSFPRDLLDSIFTPRTNKVEPHDT